ncbi:MAG: class I SAM-dependent methyltransferase [Gammaproteobacteria bacterium]
MSQALQPSRSEAPATSDGGSAGPTTLLGHSDGLELEYPVRLVAPSPWLGHTPFALWVVGALRPRVLVELGVHSGNSYCAFAQAVKARMLDTRCFGIDHWRGDEHSGPYGDEVYEELRAHHDPLYGTFSTLLRGSFDEALTYFSDGNIDLLHIDGLHTYEAAAHDFSRWLPRMSARGVVLLHDTNVRERGFGIWRLWEDIVARYPTFELFHSHGLGIAYVGSEPLSGPLAALIGAKADTDIKAVRGYFARLGQSVIERFSLHESIMKITAGEARVRALEADLQAARLEAMRANQRVAALAADYDARLRAATRQVESQASLVRRRMLITARLQQDLLAANRALDQVLRSRSWRLTAPVRFAGATLRRMLGRPA